MTKQELIQFLHEITATVREEEKAAVEIKIQRFAEQFEYAEEKEEIQTTNIYVRQLPQTMQEKIKEEITQKLISLGLYSAEIVERAMDSKISDLSYLIDTGKYERQTNEDQKKKEQEQGRRK